MGRGSGRAAGERPAGPAAEGGRGGRRPPVSAQPKRPAGRPGCGRGAAAQGEDHLVGEQKAAVGQGDALPVGPQQAGQAQRSGAPQPGGVIQAVPGRQAGGQTGGQPQRKHQGLLPVAAGSLLHGKGPGVGAGQECRKGIGKAKTPAAEEGGGAGTETEVFPQLPVGAVVAALVARQGGVADLVVGKAGLLQRLIVGKVAVGGGIVIGAAGGHAGGIKRGARLDFEQVGGKMGDPQREAVFRQAAGFFGSLTGGGQHKIRRDVGKARLLGHLHGGFALGHGMTAAQQPQHLVLAVLQAKGDTVEAGLPQPLQQGQRDGAGVGLHGDLGVGRKGQLLADSRQQVDEGFSQQGGGTAPEIEGGGGAVRNGGRFDRAQQGGGIAAALRKIAAGNKAAVAAAAAAERDMEIQADRAHSKGTSPRKG